MIIDLGCGENKMPNSVGVDNVKLSGVDVVHDLLDFPYPFTDDSAEIIYLNHVIEHFTFSDTQRIFDECHRILKLSGLLHIRVPHIFSIAAWVDPTHRRAFTFDSATFWTVNSQKAYYKETNNNWMLLETSSQLTWLNWKRYRLRPLDLFLGKPINWLINYLLRLENWPGAADLLVRLLPIYFVEIRWVMQNQKITARDKYHVN